MPGGILRKPDYFRYILYDRGNPLFYSEIIRLISAIFRCNANESADIPYQFMGGMADTSELKKP